jgi:hypothetical protein
LAEKAFVDRYYSMSIHGIVAAVFDLARKVKKYAFGPLGPTS